MSGVYHGGGLDAAIRLHGGKRSQWLDLSTGINPVPYPVPKFEQEAWARLPDVSAEADLLEAAREYYCVGADFEIVAAAGTQALIQLLPNLLDCHEVRIVSPAYGEHAHVWESAGRKIQKVNDLLQAATAKGISVIVNPNNPDCRTWTPDEVSGLAEKSAVVIADEAFCDAVPLSSAVPEMTDNMIVLKSFGKFFGLAGLRLGFLVARAGWAERVRQMLGPWAVSGPALAIGTKALRDQDWIEETRNRLEQDARELADILTGAGLEVRGINPLFVYAYHEFATELQQYLASKHVLVRPFPDNPQFLRFGFCRDRVELERLATILQGYRHA